MVNLENACFIINMSSFLVINHSNKIKISNKNQFCNDQMSLSSLIRISLYGITPFVNHSFKIWLRKTPKGGPTILRKLRSKICNHE